MTRDRTPEQAAQRRIVLVAAALMLVVVGLGLVLRSVLGRSPGAVREAAPDLRQTSADLAEVTRENWGKAEFISPHKEELDRASGEVLLPFQGFAVSVETEPAGARVTVDEREIGESPALAAVECQPGSPVRIRVEKAPLHPQERTTRCRADKLVKLRVRLTR
jgi:hypothetical protein